MGLLGLTLVCAGCGKEIKDENNRMITIEKNFKYGYKIIYDKETKVKYYITAGYTPLYDTDDTLQLYEGE